MDRLHKAKENGFVPLPVPVQTPTKLQDLEEFVGTLVDLKRVKYGSCPSSTTTAIFHLAITNTYYFIIDNCDENLSSILTKKLIGKRIGILFIDGKYRIRTIDTTAAADNTKENSSNNSLKTAKGAAA